MRKLLTIVASLTLLLSLFGFASAFTPTEGDYTGNLIFVVDNPSTIQTSVDVGNQTLTIDGDNVHVDAWKVIDGVYYDYGSWDSVLRGNSMHIEGAEDAVIDFTGPPFFMDAVILIKKDKGVSIWTSDTSFRTTTPMLQMHCDGGDCDIAAIMMFEDPTISFPVNLGTCITEHVLME